MPVVDPVKTALGIEAGDIDRASHTQDPIQYWKWIEERAAKADRGGTQETHRVVVDLTPEARWLLTIRTDANTAPQVRR